MGPQATLTYLGMLWQVALYRGMTLDRYLVYRNESLRTMTERYNLDEESMDDVHSLAEGVVTTLVARYTQALTTLVAR